MTHWRPHDPDPEGPGSSDRSGDERELGQAGTSLDGFAADPDAGREVSTEDNGICALSCEPSGPHLSSDATLETLLESWYSLVCLIPPFLQQMSDQCEERSSRARSSSVTAPGVCR